MCYAQQKGQLCYKLETERNAKIDVQFRKGDQVLRDFNRAMFP